MSDLPKIGLYHDALLALTLATNRSARLVETAEGVGLRVDLTLGCHLLAIATTGGVDRDVDAEGGWTVHVAGRGSVGSEEPLVTVRGDWLVDAVDQILAHVDAFGGRQAGCSAMRRSTLWPHSAREAV
ncbi:hypothetical protein [Rhodococcus tibetensis]|uniref:Uncharacterized protein n=1 Tax=Rhodococcus tibetensis TaxID=2965064 RepID=A0ABT1QLR9_9NOCA|nr:hypothetical protein [Rhodococcus sp. FXJ9.536]MCQ4122037.1 hypothetical protein [Rhodococcus sp. FXJ9.536]